LANTFVAEVLLESTKPGEILSGIREKMAEYSGGNEEVLKQQEVLTNVTDALRTASDILSNKDQKVNFQNPDLKMDKFDTAKIKAAGILMAKNLSMEGEKQTKAIAIKTIDKVYPVKEHGIGSGFGGAGSRNNLEETKDK
jgi:hypothetical protein